MRGFSEADHLPTVPEADQNAPGIIWGSGMRALKRSPLSGFNDERLSLGFVLTGTAPVSDCAPMRIPVTQMSNEALLRQLLDAMPSYVFLVDRDVSILDYNAAAGAFTTRKSQNTQSRRK